MASATDLLQEVGINTATTLDAPGYTIGDTSITVAATASMPTATGITFAMDELDADGEQVAGSYNEYVGVVSTATSITGVSHQNGTNRNYSAGTSTRVYLPVSAERENRIVEWGLVHADQDGTLKAGAVDVAAVLASDVVTTAKILNSNVTTAKIADTNVTNAKLAADISPAKFANPYKFSAYRNTAWTTPNNTTAVVVFDTEHYDTGTNFSVSTGIFTAPIAGFYLFHSVTCFQAAVVGPYAMLYVNGTEARRGYPTNASSFGTTVSSELQLAVNDTVEVRIFTPSTVNGTTGANFTYFQGSLRSAA